MSHPAAPVPPRSRAGAHILSLFAGLVLTPVALACLAGGAHAVTSAVWADQDASAAAYAAVLVGSGLLGVVAATCAGSAVGAISGGLLFGLVPGAAFLFWPESAERVTIAVFDPLEPIGGARVLDGLLLLGATASLVVLGLLLVLVGVAAGIARRGGRATEREEENAVAARAASPGLASAPVAPRTRRLDHVVSLLIGLLVTPIALVLLAAGSAEISAAAATGEPVSFGLLVGSGVLGTGLLAVVVLSAGWSTLGLLVGSAVYAVLPGVLGLVSTAWSERGVAGLLLDVGNTLDPTSTTGLEVLISTGVLLAWGTVGALGAVGIHVARRDGRRRERAELSVRQATVRPAS